METQMKKNFLNSLKFVATLAVVLSVTAYAVDFKTNLDVMVHGKQSSSADKDIVFDLNLGASNPRIRANKGTGNLEFSNDGATFTEIGSGSGGGGGFFDPSDMLESMDKSEAGTYSSRVPNEIRDNFNTSNGTVTNMSASSGSLGLVGVNLSGSYERTRLSNATAKAFQGALRGRLQQLAPKNTAMAPSSTASSVTVLLSGDVSNMFQATKNVIIVKKTTNDTSEVFFKAVRDTASSPEKVAVLPVSSVSYSSGPDETTLVLTNSLGLDLDLDVSSSNYATDLRIIPFDVKLYAKGAGSYAVTDMGLTDLISLSNIGIAGESLATIISGLTGSLYKLSAKKSQNGQYYVATLIEQTAGATNVHRIYSVNSGNTWQTFGAVSTGITGGSNENKNEYAGEFQYTTNSHLFVANNGKAVFLEPYLNPNSNIGIKGRYSDLSVGSPSLSDLPTTGTDSGNSYGGASIVFSITTTHMIAQVWGDETDGSGIAISGVNVSSGAFYLRQYNSGGSAYLNISGTLFSMGAHNIYPHYVAVSGSSGSHRYFVVGNEAANQRAYYSYVDEGSGTVLGQNFISTAVNAFILGVKHLNSKLYVLFVRPASNDVAYASVTTSGSPSVSSEKVLTDFYSYVDQYNGWSSASFTNWWKNFDHTILINPSNSNHVFFTFTPYDRDNGRRPRLVEVRDDTSFVGTSISQLSQNAGSNHGLNDIAGRQKIGQTFTFAGTRVRSVSFSMSQANTMMNSGYSLFCEIYATSGGLPTGSAIATSQTIDPSLISVTAATAGQPITCNFDTQTLTGVYAVVLNVTYPTSATRYILVHDNSTNPYAGGTYVEFDGSTWTSLGSYDMVFNVSGEWNYGFQNNSIAAQYNQAGEDKSAEASIELIDSSNIALVNRQMDWHVVFTKTPYQGQLLRRVINIGSGSTKSTISSKLVQGYSSTGFDDKLLVNSNPGLNANAQKNTVTGALDSTKMFEDRSQNMHTTTYTNVVAGTFVTDGSFANGKAFDTTVNSGSLAYAYYSDSNTEGTFNLSNRKFAMETEIKLSAYTPGGYGTIMGMFAGSDPNQTVIWAIDGTGGPITGTPGKMFFQVHTGQTISTNVLSLNTYYKVKVTGDGSTIRMYINDVEVGYSAQLTTGYSHTNLRPVSVGSAYTAVGSSGIYARIGYVKYILGSNTFAYSGYRDQSPYVSLIDLGSRTLAKKVGGTNGTTNGTNFYEPASLSSATSAMVDSYDMDLIYNYPLDSLNQGDTLMLKLNYGRASSRNISVFPSLNFRAVQ
jgi:3D (Asp-Asp-Asp) domain-containing protein